MSEILTDPVTYSLIVLAAGFLWAVGRMFGIDIYTIIRNQFLRG